jgi:hypothetical protein
VSNQWCQVLGRRGCGLRWGQRRRRTFGYDQRQAVGGGAVRATVDAWCRSQEGDFDFVPRHAWWQQDRDDVGGVVPGLELLPDLAASSVGGQLVKDDLGVRGSAGRV